MNTLPLRRTGLALGAALLAMLPSLGMASQTSVTVNATIIEVQCTAEQRLRIRACAPAQEIVTQESAKTMVEVRAQGAGAHLHDARYEIRRDERRPVLIKTVYY